MYVQPGATPNTNINVTAANITFGSWNAPTTTNATDLAKGGTSGSWSLSADGINLTLDITQNILSVIGVCPRTMIINTAEAAQYFIYPYIEATEIIFRIRKWGSSTSYDWTAVMDAGDIAEFTVIFVTSS